MIKTKVLICGITGFIGRNIAERLIKRNDIQLFGTYFRYKPNKEFIKNKKITLIKADLTNKNNVNEVTGGKDIIIQAAAVTTGSKDVVQRPYIHVTDNAIMNSLLFRSCFENKVKHLVFFSCTTMYPNQKLPVKEEDFNHQIIDKYFGVGWTKVYIEKMCEFYSRIGNTKYTAIRHSNIYGPYDKYDLERSHFFGATITKVLTTKDDKISVWGDGSEERDLLYVSDLVDFVEVILKKQKDSFELINLGLGQAFSVKDVIKKIIEVSGKKLVLKFDKSKPTIKFNLAVNIGKAYKKYDWKPKISLDEGIKKTINWYKKNIL
ncbi:MAG: NAD-dependent epimerase/dehydratase family protein [Patescibacteria group bacterium]